MRGKELDDGEISEMSPPDSGQWKAGSGDSDEPSLETTILWQYDERSCKWETTG